MRHVLTYGRGMGFYARYKLQEKLAAKDIEDVYRAWKDGKIDENTTWEYYIGVVDFILANERDKESINFARELKKAIGILEQIEPGSYKNIFGGDDAPAQPQTELTDADCLKRLVDTGFIVKNENIRDKTFYAKTRTATVPKIYKELLKMTNDSERTNRIMLNNISGVEAGLKEYFYRLAKSNKK
jgi:hypothetical protein